MAKICRAYHKPGIFWPKQIQKAQLKPLFFNTDSWRLKTKFGQLWVKMIIYIHFDMTEMIKNDQCAVKLCETQFGQYPSAWVKMTQKWRILTS